MCKAKMKLQSIVVILLLGAALVAIGGLWWQQFRAPK